MVRRDLLTSVALATAVWPLAAVAQDGNRRIGLLGVPPPSDPIIVPLWHVFIEALGNKGWMEDRNIIFDRRWSQGRPESYPQLAAALVATKPDLIIALSSQAMQAARQQTDKIPIVAIGLSDLVELGLVASLARPGGNLTGSA
jgi:putative ABC transport system substrate-binding protein